MTPKHLCFVTELVFHFFTAPIQETEAVFLAVTWPGGGLDCSGFS